MIVDIDAVKRSGEAVGIAFAPHLAIGDDVDPGVLLLANGDQRGIVPRLLEELLVDAPQLLRAGARREAPGQLGTVDQPIRLRVRADQRGRQQDGAAHAFFVPEHIVVGMIACKPALELVMRLGLALSSAVGRAGIVAAELHDHSVGILDIDRAAIAMLERIGLGRFDARPWRSGFRFRTGFRWSTLSAIWRKGDGASSGPNSAWSSASANWKKASDAAIRQIEEDSGNRSCPCRTDDPSRSNRSRQRQADHVLIEGARRFEVLGDIGSMVQPAWQVAHRLSPLCRVSRRWCRTISNRAARAIHCTTSLRPRTSSLCWPSTGGATISSCFSPSKRSGERIVRNVPCGPSRLNHDLVMRG